MRKNKGSAEDARQVPQGIDSPQPFPFWKVSIQKCPPSANEYIRTHWAVNRRQKGIWYIEIYAAFRDAMPTLATGKRKVRIEVTSTRQRDHANLWTPVDKLIVDNLVKLRWLVDDKPAYLDLCVSGKAGTPETVIEIWGEA